MSERTINAFAPAYPCCKMCGERLKIYQPSGNAPVLFCGGCESPWGLDIRPATMDDVKAVGEGIQ